MSENTSEVDLALRAMHRAAETARIRAKRYGSKLAVWRDGEVVLVEPDDFKVTQVMVKLKACRSKSLSSWGES